jgi:hypothetical protein
MKRIIAIKHPIRLEVKNKTMREKEFFEKHHTASTYAYNYKMRATITTTTKGEFADDNVLHRITTGMKDRFDESNVSIG